MPRTTALLSCLAALAGSAVLAGPAAAADKPADSACSQLSPSAAPCIGFDKLNEEAAAQCRAAGAPDTDCVMSAGHDEIAAERDAYMHSWVHRAAQFQYALGNSLPLDEAQWLGTHNSFNSQNDSTTLSHTDSNQQLTLTQQLDIDIRALELDVHWVPSLEAGGSDAVVVCHGRGPDQENFGCTNEPLLTDVLPQIAGWLNAHPDQVLLLYLEDELGNATGYADTVSQLNSIMRRPDGSSLIYRPDPAQRTAAGCTDLPMGVSRDEVRAAGAQVVLVGNCRSQWSADVFGWDDDHVESGSTPNYKPFPRCDVTYGPSVYANELVRYFEDSTFVSAAVDPTQTPAQDQASMLSPDKVADMVRCGVNLFGFDQILPDDGRLEASIWSWAPNQPDAAAGSCALQGADGRWVTAPCTDSHPAACRTAAGAWTVTPAPVTFAAASAACAAAGETFDVPRAGDQNSLLRQAAGSDPVWVDYQTG